jgi:GGDEF domain-containing protein
VKALDINVGQATLGISIGLSQWPQGMSKTKWIEQADDTRYQAKANGRSQVAVH